MALTFPRDMTSAYTWQKAEMRLQWRQEHSQQANGVTIGKDLGSPIWYADYETEPMEKRYAEALHSDFLTLGGVSRTFYAHIASRPFPIDEEGADTSVATVLSVAADRDQLSIEGLPPFFWFMAGDYIAINTAAGGVELTTVAADIRSGSTGRVINAEIAPYLRPIVAPGDALSLSPAMIELRLEKDGLSPIKRKSGNLYTVSVKARQEVR